MKNKKLLLGLLVVVLIGAIAVVSFQYSDGGEELQGAFPGPSSNHGAEVESVDTAGVFGSPCTTDECDLMDMLEAMEANQEELLDATQFVSDRYTTGKTAYGSFVQTSLILSHLYEFDPLVSYARGALAQTSQIFNSVGYSDGLTTVWGNANGSLAQTSHILDDLSDLEDLINNVCGS